MPKEAVGRVYVDDKPYERSDAPWNVRDMLPGRLLAPNWAPLMSLFGPIKLQSPEQWTDRSETDTLWREFAVAMEEGEGVRGCLAPGQQVEKG